MAKKNYPKSKGSKLCISEKITAYILQTAPVLIGPPFSVVQ
jgi:hypothetical protein